jgi:hypothetical protein
VQVGDDLVEGKVKSSNPVVDNLEAVEMAKHQAIKSDQWPKYD